jgi:hypothetical protein
MCLSSVNDFMTQGHKTDNTTYILSSGVLFLTPELPFTKIANKS